MLIILQKVLSHLCHFHLYDILFLSSHAEKARVKQWRVQKGGPVVPLATPEIWLASPCATPLSLIMIG